MWVTRGLFCGKWPMKIRHPMDLRHSVCVSYVKHMRKSLCAYTLDKSLSQKRPTKEICVLQKRPIILRSLHVSRVTHMNTSMSHVRMSHMSHVRMSHVLRPNSPAKNVWILPHIRMRHGTRKFFRRGSVMAMISRLQNIGLFCRI